eukprot:PhM_4_TR14114/c2_g3_i1/m.42934
MLRWTTDVLVMSSSAEVQSEAGPETTRRMSRNNTEDVTPSAHWSPISVIVIAVGVDDDDGGRVSSVPSISLGPSTDKNTTNNVGVTGWLGFPVGCTAGGKDWTLTGCVSVYNQMIGCVNMVIPPTIEVYRIMLSQIAAHGVVWLTRCKVKVREFPSVRSGAHSPRALVAVVRDTHPKVLAEVIPKPVGLLEVVRDRKVSTETGERRGVAYCNGINPVGLTVALVVVLLAVAVCILREPRCFLGEIPYDVVDTRLRAYAQHHASYNVLVRGGALGS